jgi:Transposase DDE domain
LATLVQSPSFASSDPVLAAELEQAWKTFQQVLPRETLDPLDPAPPQTLYTPWIVSWLLVYQRIDHNATLTEAVDEFKFRFPEEALPDCRRAEQRAFSSNTGAYSRARSRMELSTACQVADHLSNTLIEAVPSFLGQRRCFAFDGTSVLLQPIEVLRKAYPGALNQHGESPFPVLHLAVAHELTTGMTLRPQYGPMYGPQAVGEIALARPLLRRLPGRSIVLGDENFGIFVFAWEAEQAGHTALLRLTRKRFSSLRKKAREVGPGRWELTWKPSAAERRKYPELPPDAQLRGWLMAVEVEHPKKGKLTLHLFATEELSNETAAVVSARRWNVETDIRDLKRTLLLADLQGRSVAMVEKEVVLATVAFNLVNQTRRLQGCLEHLEDPESEPVV